LSVTACLIIRNEARVLARCFDSISPFIDECCIVDSGSMDASVDIARRFGARVKVNRSLADGRGRLRDFAAARNVALSMARGSWVLSIDADEVLEVNKAVALSAMLANPRLHAIEVKIISGRQRWYLPRLFRKMPWTRWHELVHEWIEIRGPIRRTDSATIMNLPDKTGKESAVARDLRLCGRQLRDNPNNLRGALYMARALRQSGQYGAAIPYYLRYSTAADFEAGRYVAEIGAAACYLLLHDFDGARQVALKAYRRNPRLAEACCVLGDASVGSGRLDLAQRWFRRALSRRQPGRNYPLFVDPSSYRAYPRARLDWIRQQLS
jgi:glycosyltransferase involved in cell wall biosynthesis